MTLAAVAAALSIAATPASARPRDSVWLSATPTSLHPDGIATITAATNISPNLNRFIYIYEVGGGNSKICQAATTCTMFEQQTAVGVHTYVSEVREFVGDGYDPYAQVVYHPWGEMTIATSNRVTITWS